MSHFLILAGLFVTAFLAATIFPAQSEALLAGLLLKTGYPVFLLIAVASVGNILGSCLNWYIGFFIERYKDRAWFPVSGKALDKAQMHYKKYGRWTLLLSWVPIIGDPLTLMAGVMKERFIVFLAIVSVVKILRYCVVAAFVV